MGKFTIDFFELMFLAESVIPKQPIARSHCFDSFSDVHYHNMTSGQRKQFFEYVQKCPGFSLQNDQCRHFFARFNPQNQFVVTYFCNGNSSEIVAYLFDGEYRVLKTKFVNPDYITKIFRIHDEQIIQE